jgi:hypothetical protein
MNQKKKKYQPNWMTYRKLIVWFDVLKTRAHVKYHMGGFTCDVLAIKICKLFESDFQNLLVLL